MRVRYSSYYPAIGWAFSIIADVGCPETVGAAAVDL